MAPGITKENMNPVVSIIMVTYNHGQFISEAIEGCLMQKADFPVELIIADDASSDDNQAIIKLYTDKNPGFIKPILRSLNIGANPNWFDAFSKCQGRYIAICEGDDYWTDPFKLQKQFDLLEADKGAGMVCTDYGRFYQATGKLKRHCFNTVQYRDEVKFRDYILDMSSIGTATVMIRKDIVLQFLSEVPQEVMDTFVGSDTPLWLFTGVYSKITVIPEDTAVYRFLENSACHFTNPEDHYEFVLKGFMMADYFYERYGNNDSHLLERLNRKKLKASLFHGYRSMNREMAKESFKKLTTHRSGLKHRIAAWLMYAGSYNKFLNKTAGMLLRANKPGLKRKKS
jgi:glycosyltransferase involved in cell wall biosynthesis